VNLTTGAGFGYGYYTQLAGVPGPFFTGAPSASTAYFTFRTSVFQLVPVETDGDINIVIALPDTFNVYYNATPHASWTKPGQFSRAGY